MSIKKCTIIIDNEIVCRIIGLSPQDNTFLWDKFGIFKEGYRFMPSFQLSRWDGKIRFYEKSGKTYTKILSEIVPYISNWGYNVSIDDRRSPVNVVKARATTDMFVESSKNEFIPDGISLRDYQVKTVNALLDEGCGFAEAATGAGKTLICAALAHILVEAGNPIIIIVPSSDLVTQTREGLMECGLDVGEYSGSEKNLDSNIVVATWQSLQNAPHIMLQFKAVIIDEAHGAKAEVIRTLVNDNGGHIAYRFGVTGTMPKPETDQYALKTSIGPVVIRITARWLIDNGFLSELAIEPIQITEKPTGEDFPDYSSERAYIAGNKDRLAKIAELIQQKRDQFGNTLVLTTSVKQGRALEKLIPDSIFLYGESKNDLRRQNYKQYADRDDVIVIASAGIASTGISIDRIFCLVLVDTGKSFIRAIQSVGRSLRKKGDKYKAHVVDIFSSLKWSKKHWTERKKYYKEAEYPTWDIEKIKY